MNHIVDPSPVGTKYSPLATVMNKRLIIPILIVLAIALTSAREFWLQPLKFVYKSGEKFTMNFKSERILWASHGIFKKIRSNLWPFNSVSGSSSVMDSIKEDRNNSLILTLKQEGGYMLAMQTKNALNEWEAEKFNSFLKENGLDEVLDHRTKTNTLTSPAKEYYSGHAKLLVQVGEKKDDAYKKVNGFPVEILLLENPYALKIGDPIHFKILFDGKPVFGVRVKVWNRFDNRTTIQNIYTEKNGTLETRLVVQGRGW